MADINAYLASLENLFIKNNTTTASYNISSSLTSRVQTFFKGSGGMHENIPIPKHLYPAVITEIESHSESFMGIGNSAKREIVASYNIACITMYGAGSSTEGQSSENAAHECIQLSQNVMNLLRATPRLSSTAYVLEAVVDNVEYNAKIRDEYYNHVSNIKLTVKMRTT